MRKTFWRVGLTALTLGAISLGVPAGPVGASNAEAKATLRLTDGTKVGAVWFDQEAGGTVVTVRLDGLPGYDGASPAGFHGEHIHRNDQAPANGCVLTASTDRTTWFTETDGHYNPDGVGHGGHDGDLPVVLVNADGDGWVKFLTPSFSVADVIGRAFIVHEKADNYGNVPTGAGATQYTPNTTGTTNATATGLTANTGNAGPRIACGVITAG